MTGSMERAIGETGRRRAKQEAYNKLHNITPISIKKAVRDVMEGAYSEKSPRGRLFPKTKVADKEYDYSTLSSDELAAKIVKLENRMYEHAHNLEFEEAAKLRNVIRELQQNLLGT
jgi:excinuclease ABC subunit B